MTNLNALRQRILKERSVEFKKVSRKPVTLDETPVPFTKTRLMQLLELKYHKKIEALIFTGTIYEVEKRLGVDATTISKWRKEITAARDKEFFNQFTAPNVDTTTIMKGESCKS